MEVVALPNWSLQPIRRRWQIVSALTCEYALGTESTRLASRVHAKGSRGSDPEAPEWRTDA